jgi:hypothetical protein
MNRYWRSYQISLSYQPNMNERMHLIVHPFFIFNLKNWIISAFFFFKDDSVNNLSKLQEETLNSVKGY